MGMSVGGSNRGIFVEMNVVPLIDVLLVLLVIFMIIPHKQKGLMAELPQPSIRMSGESATGSNRGSSVCRRVASHQSGSGRMGSVERQVARDLWVQG